MNENYENNLVTEIIKVSCGIGKSFKEAAFALKEAKKEKGKNAFNIKIYDGKRLRSKIPESFKEKAKEYLKLTNGLSKKQKEILQNFSLKDPLTGLLNKTGFVLKLEELKRKGFEGGYYILFNLDDLNKWNNKIGYLEVDKHIKIIGKAIQEAINKEKNSKKNEIMAHRLNETFGDDFLIFVPSKHDKKNLEKIKEIAIKIIEKIYEKQIEMKIN